MEAIIKFRNCTYGLFIVILAICLLRLGVYHQVDPRGYRELLRSMDTSEREYCTEIARSPTPCSQEEMIELGIYHRARGTV